MSVEITVIIPAYNLEAYIQETILSFIESGKECSDEFEIIIVDDGSSDATSDKVCEMQSKYPQCNLKLIKQPNRGVSCARNNGLSHARGKYVWFFDGDDLLAKGSMSIILKEINKFEPLDFYRVQFANYSENSENSLASLCFIHEASKSISGYELIQIDFGGHTSFLWNKEFLLTHQILYPEHISNNEDWLFLMKALLIAQNGVENKTLACYIVRPRPDSVARKSYNLRSANRKFYSCVYVAEQMLRIAHNSVDEVEKHLCEQMVDRQVLMTVRELATSNLPLTFVKYWIHQMNYIGLYPVKNNTNLNLVWRIICNNRIVLYLASRLYCFIDRRKGI